MEMTKHQIEAIAKQKRTGNSPTDNAFRHGYAQAIEDALAILHDWLDENFPDTYIDVYDVKECIDFELFNRL